MVLTAFTEAIEDDNFIYQRDNAPVHSSRHTKDTRDAWPACFPNLNPVKNLRQFQAI